MRFEHLSFWRSVAAGLLVATLAACSSDSGEDSRAEPTPTPGNPPTAVDDAYIVSPGARTNIAAVNGVLANDTTPEGVSQLTVVAAPVNGNVTLNNDGSFSYVHVLAGAASRTDSFVYEITDENGQTDRASVQITANTSPSAVRDLFQVSFNEETCLDVLNNDEDPDGDVITLTDDFRNIRGSSQDVRIQNGRACYTATQTGTNQFDYVITDGFGGTADATVFIEVVGEGNEDVQALNDTFQVARGGGLTVTAPGVRLNDVIDRNAATQNENNRVELISAPTQHDDRDPSIGGAGNFVLNRDGSFSYLHDGSDEVVDVFEYVLIDDTSDPPRRSSTASVTIEVVEAAQNEAPNARNETVNATAGGTVDVAVLYNDTDREDGVPEFVTITNPPACGTVDDSFIQRAGQAAPADNLGIVRYQNNSGLENCQVRDNTQLTDSFSYQVQDLNGATDQATVTILISNDPNRAPVAADDELGTPADIPLRISVLQNDSDPDGDQVILQLADGLDADDINGCDDSGATDPDDECNTQRATGQVSFDPDTGVLLYQPISTDIVAPPYVDSFEYKINDGRGLTATATVTVNVRQAAENRNPVACDEPVDSINGDDPPGGCIDINPGNAVDANGQSIRLFRVPACAPHELALNVLVNDTDLDPEDRPPYRFQPPAFLDGTDGTDPMQGNKPRHVYHAPADAEFGVGALRISEVSTTTGTGQPGDLNNGRRSLIRISDDRRFIYYQHVGAENTGCQPTDFVDTFTYTVTDDKGGTDAGLIQVTVDSTRLDDSCGDDMPTPMADCDLDAVPDSEDQCLCDNDGDSAVGCVDSMPPASGIQTATPSTTIFANGCNLIEVGTALRNQGGIMPSVDPDADQLRGTDDICPESPVLDDDDCDGVGNADDQCPDEAEDGITLGLIGSETDGCPIESTPIGP